jgi:hypothetical protein
LQELGKNNIIGKCRMAKMLPKVVITNDAEVFRKACRPSAQNVVKPNAVIVFVKVGRPSA